MQPVIVLQYGTQFAFYHGEACAPLQPLVRRLFCHLLDAHQGRSKQILSALVRRSVPSVFSQVMTSPLVQHPYIPAPLPSFPFFPLLLLACFPRLYFFFAGSAHISHRVLWLRSATLGTFLLILCHSPAKSRSGLLPCGDFPLVLTK